MCDEASVVQDSISMGGIWEFTIRFCCFENFYDATLGGKCRLPQPSRGRWLKQHFLAFFFFFSFLKPFAHNHTVYICLNNYYCQAHKQSPPTAV